MRKSRRAKLFAAGSTSVYFFCKWGIHMRLVPSGFSSVVLPIFVSTTEKFRQLNPLRLVSQHVSSSKWLAPCCAPRSLLSGARTFSTDEHSRDEKQGSVYRPLVPAFLEPQHGLMRRRTSSFAGNNRRVQLPDTHTRRYTKKFGAYAVFFAPLWCLLSTTEDWPPTTFALDMNTARKLGPHTQTDRGTCPGVGL
jgi:hypothetical protein